VPDGHLEAGTTEDHDAADGSEGLVRRSEKSGWPLIFFFLRPPKVPHAICPKFVQTLPTGDVLPATRNPRKWCRS
jgi:hypothetical protein